MGFYLQYFTDRNFGTLINLPLNKEDHVVDGHLIEIQLYFDFQKFKVVLNLIYIFMVP